MNSDQPETLTSSTSLPLNLGQWLSAESAHAEIGDTRHAEAGRRILEAAEGILAQAELLLESLSVESYREKMPVAFNASIGGHLRHCLDHFTSVVRGRGHALVDYDQRARDVRIETDPEYALEVTRGLRRQLEQVTISELACHVVARCEVSYGQGNSPVTGSSFGREMVYCIAHAIHHYALIAVMARLQGTQLPDHFGVAPSTVAHQRAARA